MTTGFNPPPPPPLDPMWPAQFAPPPRTSGTAIASLVLGILGCVPFVTSVLALILGMIGLRATKNEAMRGRGLAISGFILGIVGVAGWTGMGIFMWFLISTTAPARATLYDFAANVSRDDIPAAQSEAVSSISTADLHKLHTILLRFGTYSDATCMGVYIHSTGGGASCQLNGTMRFSGGSHSFTAEMEKDGADWKVRSFFIF